jgi:hypothetical protein
MQAMAVTTPNGCPIQPPLAIYTMLPMVAMFTVLIMAIMLQLLLDIATGL